jgi:hypothetical protein
MEKASSCGICVQAYKSGKTMEQCRAEARKIELLSDEILKKGEVSLDKGIRSSRS